MTNWLCTFENSRDDMRARARCRLQDVDAEIVYGRSPRGHNFIVRSAGLSTEMDGWRRGSGWIF